MEDTINWNLRYETVGLGFQHLSWKMMLNILMFISKVVFFM